MLGRTNIQLKMRALIVDDELAKPGSGRGRAVAGLAEELRNQNVEVAEAVSYEDGLAIVSSDAGLHCYFVDWTLGMNDEGSHAAATEVLRAIRARNARAPVFLMADRDPGVR